MKPTNGRASEKSSGTPSPAKGKSPRPGEIVWDDEPGGVIILGAPGPERLKKPEAFSNAPSPAEGDSLRPEDVVIEEMDDGIGGIIITAPPNPAWARKKKPESDK
jgi:hypothetical protein